MSKKKRKKKSRKATQPSATNGRRRAGGPDPSAMYEQTATGFVWHRPGALAVPLTNFTATITEDVELVDEAGRRFTIEVTIVGRPPVTVSVSLADFLKMQWPMALLGAGAIVYAGMGAHDHTRAAIQTISTPVRKRVYSRLGWRKINDAWHYLYAGGAIGPDGSVSDIAVEPPPALKLFTLPDPPTEDARVAAVRASLGLLELGPARIMVVLVAILACAILGETDFSVHLVGRSGVFKTALAVLVQQHWGASMDVRHLPTGWGSTDNAIESILARAGDTIVCVDDFNPIGTPSNVQRAHQGMERVVRAQGNQ